MFSTKDFPDQASLDRAVERVRRRETEEAARTDAARKRESDNQTAMKAALSNVAATANFPWMDLRSLDNHPDVRSALEAMKKAQRTLNQIVNSKDDAERELSAAEDRAALGERDDVALRRARERLNGYVSEVRIAERAVALAEQAYTEALRTTTFACAAYLQTQHEAELQLFDAALEVAQRHSQRLAELERKSSELISDGPYTPKDRRWACRLRVASWRKEFGRGGFFDYWRKYHRLRRQSA
jgi:hypothetical protein